MGKKNPNSNRVKRAREIKRQLDRAVKAEIVTKKYYNQVMVADYEAGKYGIIIKADGRECRRHKRLIEESRRQ